MGIGTTAATSLAGAVTGATGTYFKGIETLLVHGPECTTTACQR
jgi:hypothetical protein